ncbi:hypothetical protein QJS63_00215 [Pseudomonas juntendi]|nr:hypothetical protein QJS63_00215 [Pseudomonas juntendi]
MMLPSTEISAEQASQPYRSTTAVTATKTDIPLKDVPQTVDVVPAELIKDRNITTLQAPLRMSLVFLRMQVMASGISL